MVKWTYGKEGEAYQVEQGDVWKVGEHYFVNADITQEAPMLDDLIETLKPTTLYVDPPWNMGNLVSFYTKAGKGKPPFDFNAFINALLRKAMSIEGDCFLEAGKQNLIDVEGSIVALGGTLASTQKITYYQKHECYLIHFRWHSSIPLIVNVTGRDDDDTPQLTIGACSSPGDYILDLCAGRGLTSRSAEQLGRYSLNAELHPNRMSAALYRMKALSKQEPVLFHRSAPGG